MKPAPFVYHAPQTVDEALDLLAEAGDRGRLLAGGQSLVPLLNMRLARPEVVIDLNRIGALAGVSQPSPEAISIGAMTRQRVLETDPLIQSRLGILAQAAGHIAHVAIRTRGTVGGSLAHADPAAELPAMMLLLEAEMVTAGSGGRSRRIPADQFFLGPWTTALATDEMLVAVEIRPPTAHTAFAEFAKVNGAFALVGAGAVVEVTNDGRIGSARIAFCGLSSTPRLFAAPDDLVFGRRLDDNLAGDVARAVEQWAEPVGDIHARPDYRRRVAGVLTRRVLAAALEEPAA